MKTAQEYREDASQHEQEARDSFERCDTDGFVSQWASGLNGQVARANARIAEAGGIATFTQTRLVTLDGEATDARRVNTRFGTRWRLDSTDEWLPYMPVRESTLGKRGYREIEVAEVATAKAIVDSPSGARGLSGATQCYVRTIRTDMPQGQASKWGCRGDGDRLADDER